MNKFKVFFFILTIISALFVGGFCAFYNSEMADFASLPVLHEGRVKPLDSMARSELRYISERDCIDGLSATEWAAEVFFDTDKAARRPIFPVRTSFVREQLKLDESAPVYLSFAELIPGLDKTRALSMFLSKKDRNMLSLEEKELVLLHEKAVFFLSLPDQNLFGGDENPYSDWWIFLRQSYMNDEGEWESDLASLKGRVYENPELNPSQYKIAAELIYNKIKPWFLAQVLYALSLILLTVFLLRQTNRFKEIFVSIIPAALILQFTALLMRIYILGRPPVGSLYESMLFVSFIIPLVSFMAWRKFKDLNFLAGGAMSALFLLSIAPSFVPEGDSLEVLVAVLNTNFWLATHVICITAGYALCIFTSCLAHAALFQRGFTKSEMRVRMISEKRIDLFLTAALFFTAFGTILGGIWADQSWGRFWGWDPKENGALLIVLWIIWVMHGKRSGHIGPVFYLSALCALNLVVAFSWVGVNLLGTGLHSYGFMNQTAWGLFSFCALEIIVIALLTARSSVKI